MLKIDLEKAYDNVAWDYDYMLRRFWFGAKWKGWI